MTAESLVVVRRGSLFLLLHRCPEDGAYWHVAGGGVEEGESFADAAVRELREETGLEAAVSDVDVPYRYGEVEGRVFLADAPGGWEPTLNDEHDGYRWASRAEAAALLRWDEPREAIEALLEDAPPYGGEGEHALWHVSEDDAITRFVPHLAAGRHPSSEPLVWAVDTRHLPLYWFPRDCPRACFWAASWTSDEDAARFLDRRRAQRVHLVEPEWLGRTRSARVVAYRLPADTFERWDRFWVSREPVAPLEVVELDDLVGRHARAGIRLDSEPDLLERWDEVIASTLEFSGIRLRNAREVARS